VELTQEEIELLKETIEIWKWANQKEDLLKYRSRDREILEELLRKLEGI
jgi:hypothetical protein